MELGKQLARIVDYGVTENKSGNGSVFIKFIFPSGEYLTWYGSLKEGKAAEITVSTLFECGFSGDDINALAKGVESGLLITDEDIDVNVQKEIDPTGTERIRIKYIGSGKEIPRIDQEQARKLIPASVNMMLREMKRTKKPREKKDPNFEIPFGT